MKKLIERSYEAIKQRGLITDKTTRKDFVSKMLEEDNEYFNEFLDSIIEVQALSPFELQELIQSITVRIMYLRHLGYDFVHHFEEEVKSNEKRAGIK